jgi:O-antigen/teichoic acid export membrane protein
VSHSQAVRAGASVRVLDRPLVADSLRYAVSKVVPGLTGLAAVVVFLRLAGAAEYGRFALGFSIANAAASFFTGWIGQAVLRDHEHLDGGRTGRSAVQRALLLSVAAGALLLGVLWIAAWPERSAYGVGGIALVVFLHAALGCYTLRVAQLQSRLQAGMVMRVSVAQGVLGFAAPLFLLLVWQRSAHALLFGMAVAYAAAVLMTLRAQAPAVREGSGDTDDLLRRAWRYGWPLSFWFACIALFQVADRYLLQRHLDFEAVGSYAALFDILVRGVALALFPLTMAAHPRIMQLWNGGRTSESLALVQRTAVAQAVLFAAGAALFLALARPLAGVLPDVELRPAVVLPLLLAAFAWQMAFLAHKPLELARRTHVMLLGAAGALALHVALMLWLLPRYGVAAAAWSYLAAGACYVGFSLAAGALTIREAEAHG